MFRIGSMKENPLIQHHVGTKAKRAKRRGRSARCFIFRKESLVERKQIGELNTRPLFSRPASRRGPGSCAEARFCTPGMWDQSRRASRTHIRQHIRAAAAVFFLRISWWLGDRHHVPLWRPLSSLQ
ncbi:hypothetical protein AAFF_G00375480 [Aldrovandia affinis]|uniref:Uncharacterized protein n=1 Tax=Aldrovandia affinis TaxID=143900 RepID=A0AAD7WM54_9TELE|nr:hypothetical protein AAFF_G00375480 [Aldrovandia affinis]